MALNGAGSAKYSSERLGHGQFLGLDHRGEKYKGVCIPETYIVLQNAVCGEMIKIKRPRKRIARVGANRLAEKDDGVAASNVEALKHGVREDRESYALAVVGEISMVGEGV